MIDWKAIERNRKRLRFLFILYDVLYGVFHFLALLSLLLFVLSAGKGYFKELYWYYLPLFAAFFFVFPAALFTSLRDRIPSQWWNYYYSNALLPFVRENLKGFEYEYYRFFPREEFIVSYLFYDYPHPAVYTGQDYLKGSYKGKPLECSWIGCGYYNWSDSYTNIFRGLVLKLSLYKSVDGFVLLYPQGSSSLSGFKRLSLDSEEFNRSFHVYSDSELTAFYALDHALMERLVKFKRAYPNARFSFVKNTLYIALPDFYLFYIPAMNQSVLKAEKEYKQNLSLFFSLLDVLDIERMSVKLS